MGREFVCRCFITVYVEAMDQKEALEIAREYVRSLYSDVDIETWRKEMESLGCICEENGREDV